MAGMATVPPDLDEVVDEAHGVGALLLRLAVEVLGQPGQALAVEVGGDGHVLQHRPELVPDLLVDRVVHLVADQHFDLLDAPHDRMTHTSTIVPRPSAPTRAFQLLNSDDAAARRGCTMRSARRTRLQAASSLAGGNDDLDPRLASALPMDDSRRRLSGAQRRGHGAADGGRRGLRLAPCRRHHPRHAGGTGGDPALPLYVGARHAVSAGHLAVPVADVHRDGASDCPGGAGRSSTVRTGRYWTRRPATASSTSRPGPRSTSRPGSQTGRATRGPN